MKKRYAPEGMSDTQLYVTKQYNENFEQKNFTIFIGDTFYNSIHPIKNISGLNSQLSLNEKYKPNKCKEFLSVNLPKDIWAFKAKDNYRKDKEIDQYIPNIYESIECINTITCCSPTITKKCLEDAILYVDMNGTNEKENDYVDMNEYNPDWRGEKTSHKVEYIKCQYPDCDCQKYWKHLPLRPFLPYNFHDKFLGSHNKQEYFRKIKTKYIEKFIDTNKRSMLHSLQYLNYNTQKCIQTNNLNSKPRPNVKEKNTDTFIAVSDVFNKLKYLFKEPLKSVIGSKKKDSNEYKLELNSHNAEIFLYKSSSFSTNEKKTKKSHYNLEFQKRLFNSLNELTGRIKNIDLIKHKKDTFKAPLKGSSESINLEDQSKSKVNETNSILEVFDNNSMQFNNNLYATLPPKTRLII